MFTGWGLCHLVTTLSTSKSWGGSTSGWICSRVNIVTLRNSYVKVLWNICCFTTFKLMMDTYLNQDWNLCCLFCLVSNMESRSSKVLLLQPLQENFWRFHQLDKHYKEITKFYTIKWLLADDPPEMYADVRSYLNWGVFEERGITYTWVG